MHHRVDEVRGGHGAQAAELGWDDDVEAARGGEDQSLPTEALESFAHRVLAALEQACGVCEREGVHPGAEEVVGQVVRGET